MQTLRHQVIGGLLAVATAVTALPATAAPMRVDAPDLDRPLVQVDSREDWIFRNRARDMGADWVVDRRDRREARRDWRDDRRDWREARRDWRQDRREWRRDRWRERRWRDRDDNLLGAGIAGLATGALLGGVLAPRVYAPPVYAPAPVYSYRPGSSAWISYCSSKYRSFDPRSGTYLGYDGRRHYCR